MTTRPDIVKKRLLKAYKRYNHPGKGGWRSVAKDFGVTCGTAQRMATIPGYEPKKEEIRKAFDLPSLILTTACYHCGKVHKKKSCPDQRKYRRFIDMPPGLLALLLKYRKPF